MSVKSFTGRVLWYQKKHGSIRLIRLSFQKALTWINRKEVLYCLDLNTIEADSGPLGDGVTVDCYHKAYDIPLADMEQLVRLKGKEVLTTFLESFFGRSASLWLMRENGKIASLVWSKVGGFSGYYMGVPIFPNDAIMMAGETFPDFRGRRFISALMRAICESLKKNGISRVYGGAHVSNVASQRAQSKAWRRIGVLRHFGLAKWHIAIWDKNSLMVDYK